MIKRFSISFGVFLGALLSLFSLSYFVTSAAGFDDVLLREKSYAHLVETSFAKSLSGKILLQVEENGEAWYVHPENFTRLYLGRPSDAFHIMREVGLGISNEDISKLPDSTENFESKHDLALAKNLSGKILLQVEENGEAWYVNTETYKRHYLGRPADAFIVMRELGLGISNTDIRKIALGQSVEGGDLAQMNKYPFFSNVSVSTTETTMTVTSNGIPDHETGQFPNSGNPNTISEQDIEKTFTLNPQIASSITNSGGREFGIALNGILFEPLTGEYYNNDPSSGWNLEWSTNDLGFDFNNAHVQPDGTYHYHGSPTNLLAKLDGANKALIGYAADGFPIYVEAASSSYRIKSGTRPDGPGGTYDGTYVQDYEYSQGLGDLDVCNGKTGVTAEYPEGTYYYVVSENFPIISRCFSGTPDASFSKGGGGQGPPTGNGPGGPPPRN